MEFALTQNKSPIDSQSLTTANHQTVAARKPFWFFVCFSGYMDMYGDLETVAKYLNAHEDWFGRCAKPMKVEPFGENGYILNVGRFGSLGYEVEPKIAVILDPPQNNLYVMRTVPIPDYKTIGYEVQYRALMELARVATDEINAPAPSLLRQKIPIPSIITRVSWQLDLAVTVEFPRFITRLPANLIQTTGDRVLAQIVRQISPRLTYKVQQDFHNSQGLPLPGKNSRGFSKIEKECDFIVPTYNSDTMSLSLTDRVSKESNRAA